MPNGSKASAGDVEEVYESVHQQIGREETLINNRITWQLVFHGLLFNVIGQSSGTSTDPEVARLLKSGIPIVGFGTAILGLVGVVAAYLSIRGIQATWRGLPAAMRQRRAAPFGGKWIHRLGMAPGVGIPLVLALIWIWIWWGLQ